MAASHAAGVCAAATPAVNLRPSADWPDRAVVAVDLARAVVDRIAADIDELARARRVEDLGTAAVLPSPADLRRRNRRPLPRHTRRMWVC